MREILITLAIAFGLAMDSFTVSLGAGCSGLATDLRSKVRLVFHLAFFQAAMTLLGWLAGSKMERLISQVDHWIALGLLTYVGVRMIQSGLSQTDRLENIDPTRGRTMVMLSLATSIDALAVGFSMALAGQQVLSSVVVIGLVTFVLSFIGVQLGDQLGESFGKRMEIVGGVILIAIGVRILIAHLF
jgi:manganese efflux pump family protein